MRYLIIISIVINIGISDTIPKSNNHSRTINEIKSDSSSNKEDFYYYKGKIYNYDPLVKKDTILGIAVKPSAFAG